MFQLGNGSKAKTMNKYIYLKDLLKKDFKEVWDLQTSLLDSIVQMKKEKRNSTNKEIVTPNYFLFVEHPHVYTLGKSGDLGRRGR